jgi:hypothetical protein
MKWDALFLALNKTVITMVRAIKEQRRDPGGFKSYTPRLDHGYIHRFGFSAATRFVLKFSPHLR